MYSGSLSSFESITKYRSKRPQAHLIVDTNVFLLFFIGCFDPEYVKDCPLMTENGRMYDKRHFEILEKIFQMFLFRIVVTPHVLAEVNMLSTKRMNLSRPRFAEYFSKMVDQLNRCTEHHVPMKALFINEHSVEFGFTDMSLVEASKEKEWMVITDEINLYTRFSEKIPVLYFNAFIATELLTK